MISVIVPVYNVELYIERCLDSILLQSFSDLEIIIVNDGSNDRSGEICERYAALDTRVVVIHQCNKGVSAARNTGLSAAHGEYISFIDADDYILPDMYKVMVENMRGGMCVVGSGCTSEIVYKYTNECYCVNANNLISGCFSGRREYRLQIWNKLFRNDLICTQRFDESLKISEDVVFLCEYIKKIKYAVVVDDVYYIHVVREGSAIYGGTKGSEITKIPLTDDRIVEIGRSLSQESYQTILFWAIYDCMGWRSTLYWENRCLFSKNAIKLIKKVRASKIVPLKLKILFVLKMIL